ncbi:hypothetical protein A4X13_0g5021 [Tilletia indica]|uniref:non-specific serine/threonine protein kinase n=1 Tax=Tilletia indica TaxID=43049 RepID=A0A177TQP5_9BASI|nr:hypothetical protein A4X13_0g5021 [Tilletia indica]
MSSAAAYSPAALFLSSFSASIPSSLPPPQPQQPFNPDQEGSRFGPGLRYSLGRVIGHGGSSTVREGSDLGEKQHRRVAIKIVNPTEDTPSQQQQPHDEPALWKTLAPHPHILPLLYHERCASHDLFVMPFCNRGNLLTHVRTEAGRRAPLPSNTPRLSRAGTLTSIFAAQSPSANQRAAGLPPTDTDTAADSHPFKVSRSHSINGPPDPHLRSRHPSSTGPPDSSSTNMRIVTPSKVGSLPRDSADSFTRLSMIPAGSEVSPTSNSRDSDFKLPYMGGGRSPSAAGSPSTSFISRHGSIRSIGSTRSRGQAAEWASRGVPLSAAREILRQLCEALTVLHCRTHLVHGDLKLENVLGQAAGLHLGSVSANGEGTNKASDDAMEVLREGEENIDATQHVEDICWRIADFGLSRKVQEDEHSPPEALKLAIDRGGTLPYAAPELLRERVQASPISPTAKSESAFHDNNNSPSPSHKDSAQSMASPYASDMWALGCILYALLSGRLPFVDSFEPRLQAKIVKAEWDMPARLRRARERRAAAAGASSSTAIVGGLPSQARDSSDFPASAWSLRARTASADQSSEVVDDGTTSALSRFSRPSPGSGNGNTNGGAHSWFPNRSGSQPATMRRMMSPQGLGRISSLSRAGRAGDPFGSSTSSSMFRGSSPLRESVLLDLQDLSASMPALSPPLGIGNGMGTTVESADALQPSVELDAEAGVVVEEIDSDAEEGHDVEWDGRSAERAAAREVLSGLLQPDPCRRWTVEQLSRSRWLSAEFADEGSISSNPFRRNLFRRMSEYEQEGIPSSLLAIVEDMRAGEPKKQSQQPWRRLPDKSPSPLPSGDIDPNPPSLVFERRAVSVERGGNRRASSLTRTRPVGDDVSNSSSRERIARPAVEEEDEGRGGPLEVEQNERLGRLGRDGRPKLDRFFAGAGVRSRSTSRLLEIEGVGAADESDGANADASLRGRGRRMHSPATHQRRTGRSTSSQRSPHGLSHPRDSALEIVPLRSVSATRSRGFELADLTEDDLGSPRMSISPRMGSGPSASAAVGRDIRRRSARPIEIPQLDSNHPSDSDRSRSRSRSRARPPLSRSTSGTGNGGGGGGGPGGASVTTGSSTTQMDRREALAKF